MNNSQNRTKFTKCNSARFSKRLLKQKDVRHETWVACVAYDPDHYVGSKLHVTEVGSTVAVDGRRYHFRLQKKDDLFALNFWTTQ